MYVVIQYGYGNHDGRCDIIKGKSEWADRSIILPSCWEGRDKKKLNLYTLLHPEWVANLFAN